MYFILWSRIFKYKTNMGILSIVIEVNAELNGEEKVLQL